VAQLVPAGPSDDGLNGVVQLVLLLLVRFGVHLLITQVLVHDDVLVHYCLTYDLALPVKKFEAILAHLAYLRYSVFLV
jgi:hypothetical protein